MQFRLAVSRHLKFYNVSCPGQCRKFRHVPSIEFLLLMARALKRRVNISRRMDRSSDTTTYVPNPRNSYGFMLKLIFSTTFLAFFLVLILWLRTSQTEEYSANLINPSTDIVLNARFQTFEVLNEFPHDQKAFTQGLQYGGNDTLYESTGLYGQSSVREVHLQTGKILKAHQMNHTHFGEGLALLDERLFQVTWLTNVGYIYDRLTISEVGSFHHPMNDGWGLTSDGENLFGSDGTSTIYYFDPLTFKEKRRVIVKYEGFEVYYLNELEYINGEVWANVWQSDCIARISPKDGKVLGWIILHKLRKNLLSSGYKEIDVLNGIAWDAEKGRLFVTGKLWPKLYQIELHPLRRQAIKSLGNIRQLCRLKS